jgi:hypothetical protein
MMEREGLSLAREWSRVLGYFRERGNKIKGLRQS